MILRTSDNSLRRQAFTLIELLAVMTIMLMMMGLVVASSFGASRGQRLRAATESIRTSMALSRQYAVAHNTEVTVRFDIPAGTDHMGSNHYFWIEAIDIDGGTNQIRAKTYMPKGVKIAFDLQDQGTGNSLQAAKPALVFSPAGQVKWGGSAEPKQWLWENGGAEERGGITPAVEVEIYTLTGMVNVEWKKGL